MRYQDNGETLHCGQGCAYYYDKHMVIEGVEQVIDTVLLPAMDLATGTQENTDACGGFFMGVVSVLRPWGYVEARQPRSRGGES